MTGMKEGAGEDPFEESEPASPPQSDDNGVAGDSETESETTMTETPQPTDIPMILRRDSVQDNRDRVPLFIQDETKNEEREALRELEDRFGDDVSLTDLREALMLAGLDNLDAVEGQLRDWGYGLSFD